MKHRGTVVLETDRLLLRRFTQADAAAMFCNWANDEAVTRYLVWQPHETPSETLATIQNWQKEYHKKNFYEWIIVLKSLGEPIGSIGLVNVPSDARCCEAGYCIGKEWWNQGLTTEAMRAVLDFALNVVGYRSVIAKHAIENPASGRVMQKAGMTMRAGEILPVSTPNGLFDCILYEVKAPPHHLGFHHSHQPAPFYRIRPI